MATSNWSTFFDNVLPYVKGCAVPMAQNKIVEAAIEFCNESFVWKYDHPAVDAVAAQPTYPFVPAANTKIVRIDRAWYDGKNIYPKIEAELDALYKAWPLETGTPLYYIQDQLESVRLVPFPSAALVGALVMRVCLRPTNAAPGLDTQLWERFIDEIAAGALSKLMVMPDKPWTNTGQAAYFSGIFENGKDAARMKATKGWTRSSIRPTGQSSRFL
ncbi:MAG: hypothetical protein AABM33_05900 [Pseudomonadota bacterium]